MIKTRRTQHLLTCHGSLRKKSMQSRIQNPIGLDFKMMLLGSDFSIHPHHPIPLPPSLSLRKRSVTHAQLMHDKGRTLQEFKRRMWLHELLHEVHTAELREVQQRGGVSGGGGAVSVGVPMGVGVGVSLSPGTANPKPAGGTKNLPIGFSPEDEEGTNLPQETNKSQIYKDGAPKAGMKKKKKGKAGKRRDGEKRKRRTRSLNRPMAIEPDNGFHLERRIHTAQQAAAAH